MMPPSLGTTSEPVVAGAGNGAAASSSLLSGRSVRSACSN
jgi:hypothetical protein